MKKFPANGGRAGGPGGAYKTRVETRTEHSHLWEEIMAIFLDRGFGDVNGLTQIETERPDVEAPEKYPSLAACASPWRLPSRTAMTHVRWLHGQSGHESTDYTQSVVHCVGRWTAWLIDVCSNEDEGRSERKTPTPCVETNRQKSEAKTKTEQHTTRHAAWTGQDRTRLRDILSAHIISHQFFCRCLDGGPIRLLVFARRRLSWRAHVVQAEAAHCPLDAKRACKNGRFPQAVREGLEAFTL